MKERSSNRFNWLELAILLVLLALATLWVTTPHSTAQDNRQLQREQANRAQQQRIALVIGNGAYQNVKPLKNPPNDATLLAATLRKLGFEVTVGTNKSQREMKQLIREFGQRLRAGGGVGLFYFAGHGVQARGRNYLIPVDAEIHTEADLEDVAVDVNYVLNTMDDAQNALNIAILDACRNNPFARSFRSAQEGLAQVKAPTGTLIAYATAPDSVAADGGGANSPYVEELAKQIQVSGVLLETMFRRVAEQVSSRSGGRQEPWYSANVKGDFFFSGTANLSLSNSGVATEPARIDAVAVEREYWATVRNSNDAQDYKDYLQAYPNGAYASVSRTKIRQLETAKTAQPTNGKPIDVGNSTAPRNGRPIDVGNSDAGQPSNRANTSASRPKSFKSQQGIEMVYIPPGSFMMGSANGGASEKPAHEVTIRQGFYIGKYEVTQGQWQMVMDNNPSSFRNCGSNCPVENVSWEDAQAFINKLNEANDGFKYRLPSEAEWEYSCRGGTTGDYAGDPDAIASMAWYDKNSGNKTHEVGTKLPNAFGLFDMHGNVWEWCQDWYHENYDGAPHDGSAWPRNNELKYNARILRGGAWNDFATVSRSAYRYRGAPDYRYGKVGFRVVAVVRTQ